MSPFIGKRLGLATTMAQRLKRATVTTMLLAQKQSRATWFAIPDMKMKYSVPIPTDLKIDDPEALEREIENELRAALVRQIDENIQRDIDGEDRSSPPKGLLGA